MSAENFLDDPRLTAFALGELASEEAESMAKLVATNPEAAKFVEDIRVAARVLEGGLERERLPRLSPAQRETLAPGRTTGVLRFLIPAVALMFVAVVFGVWLHHPKPPEQVAMRDTGPDPSDQAAGILGQDGNLFERVSKTTLTYYSAGKIK